MTFVQSSGLAERFEAFLINVCFLIGICPKMSSKCPPKPYKIHHGSDPEPYQKIDVFLEGLPGGLARNNPMTLHWIYLQKGEEKERVMPKTP